MASGLIGGSNLVSQRRLKRDSFLAFKKLQECVVLWWLFFPPLSTSTNSRTLCLTISCFCKTWTVDVVKQYPKWWHIPAEEISLLHYIMWCATDGTKPTHRWPTIISSLYFWVVEFPYKGLITWSIMWSVFSLCSLPLPQPLTLSGLPFHVVPLLSENEGIRDSKPSHSGCGICRNVLCAAAAQSPLPWLLRDRAAELRDKCREQSLNTANILQVIKGLPYKNLRKMKKVIKDHSHMWY